MVPTRHTKVLCTTQLGLASFKGGKVDTLLKKYSSGKHAFPCYYSFAIKYIVVLSRLVVNSPD